MRRWNVNLFWGKIWQNILTWGEAKDLHWKRHNNSNTWSIFLILASLDSAWAILQISSITSKLHVDGDCDASNAIIAKAEKIWWLIESEIEHYLFENLNFQLMKVIDFKKRDHWIDQNSSRTIIRVKRIYRIFYYRKSLLKIRKIRKYRTI